MGFGLLLLGYLAANVMSFGYVPKFIGYAIMMWGCIKLSDYEKKFSRCLYAAAPAVILSVYLDGNKLCDLLNVSTGLFSDGFVKAITLAETVVSWGFCVLLMTAIISIAKSTDLNKIAFKAARNMVILTLGELVYVVSLFLPKGNVSVGIAYAALALRILRIVLDLLLIFACYRMICQEGDEDMPAKEIKNPVLRKMEDVLNKRDSNAYESAQKITRKNISHSNKKKTKKKK